MISTTIVLSVVLGLILATGFWLVAFRPTPRPQINTTAPVKALDAVSRRRRLLRAAMAAAAGALVMVVTGWPVGGLLAALAAWFLPTLLGPDHASTRRLERAEAVAGWTETLRDLITAAAGLQQAIVASAPQAPEPIRDEITALASAIQRGDPLVPALRTCQEQLGDPVGDLVMAALVTSARGQSGSVAELLTALAVTARDRVAMRLRIAPTRAQIRTSVRIIVGTTLALVVFLTLTSRTFLAPYDGPTGQLMLGLVGIAFAAAFMIIHRMGRDRPPHRFLTAQHRLDAATDADRSGE